MSTDIKNARSIINDLVETCKDGQQGFLDAAHHVKDHNLKSMFLEYSQQRSMFAGELQQEVMRLGGEPEKTGTTAGALHRGWIDFKSKITGQSDTAVINEAERGEDAAVKAYEKAMQAELPADLRTIVARQYKSVLEAHARSVRSKSAPTAAEPRSTPCGADLSLSIEPAFRRERSTRSAASPSTLLQSLSCSAKC